MSKTFRLCVIFCSALMLNACACLPFGSGKDDKPPVIETLGLEKAALPDIAEFENIQMAGFKAAFLKSCAAIERKDSDASYGPTALGGKVKDWIAPCKAADDLSETELLTQYFTPYIVYDNGDTNGLFTGYFLPLLHGSYKKTKRYTVPLYLLPDDLIEVDLGAFSDDLKGKNISGRVKDGRLVPYASRAEIDKGALNNRGLELVYVDDAVDAFFLHIQGSGVVELPNGKRIHIGYAGQNGHAYYAIGRELIKRGALTRENVSLQSIRDWLYAYPDQADEIMQMNASYIFFHKLDGDGALGAQGVVLTPKASLAIDRRLYPYGMPLLLDAEKPLDDTARLTRLMVAQDTGGAIRGAVRGDVFWGAGDEAAQKAGHMKSRGRFWIFLPKTIEIPDELHHHPWDGIRSKLFWWED